jgi:hypothetical protein
MIGCSAPFLGNTASLGGSGEIQTGMSRPPFLRPIKVGYVPAATPVPFTPAVQMSPSGMSFPAQTWQAPSAAAIAPQLAMAADSSRVPPLAGMRRGGRRGRHIRSVLRPGSQAEQSYREATGMSEAPQHEALASGFPATPAQDLRYRGGKTIRDLTYLNIYVGGNSSWDSADMQNIDRALAAAMSDPHLNNVLVQYFDNQPITSTALPSRVLQGAKPTVTTQGDIEYIVKYLYNQGNLRGFDLSSTAFNFMLPRGTRLNDDAERSRLYGGTDREPTVGEAPKNPTIPFENEVSSTDGLGGFHGSIHIGRDTIYYAVGVYSERLPDGTANGIPVFDKSWKNVVATFYHELQEFRTDPDVEDAIRAGDDPSAERFLGWTSDRGQEVGDYPVEEASQLSLVFKEVPLADGSGMVPVQLQYSNAVHGPEGPIPYPHGMVPPPTDDPPPVVQPKPTPKPTPTPAPTEPAETDPDLSRLDEAWPSLSAGARRAILGILDLVQPVRR